jgi:hypothetical protein
MCLLQNVRFSLPLECTGGLMLHLRGTSDITLLLVSFHNVKEAIRLRSELAEHGLQARIARKVTQMGLINWAVKC